MNRIIITSEILKVAKELLSNNINEKVGSGDSDLSFELSVGITRTDKALSAASSKLARKYKIEAYKLLQEMEKPYILLRRKSGWSVGSKYPWEDVSVKDAKQLIVLGKALRKDIGKLLRDNKLASENFKESSR